MLVLGEFVPAGQNSTGVWRRQREGVLGMGCLWTDQEADQAGWHMTWGKGMKIHLLHFVAKPALHLRWIQCRPIGLPVPVKDRIVLLGRFQLISWKSFGI